MIVVIAVLLQALSRVSTLNYALLAPLVPVLTTTLALLTGFEMFRRDTWPSWLKVGGILVAVAGAVVTAFGAIGHASSAGLDAATVITGNILLLTNKLCIAVYPLLEKRLFARGYSPVFVVAWGYATGSVLTLLAVIPCTLTAKAWTVPAAGWAAILYAGCLSSGFNYAAMAYVRDQGDAGIRSQQTPRFRPSSQVNRRTSPVLVMAFYPSQSLFTPLLSWALLGTGVSAEEGVGGAVIVVGEWGAHGGAHGGGQPAHAPAVAGAGLLGVAAAKWAEGARRPAAVAEPSDASGAAETPGLSDAAAAAVAAATAGGDVTVDVVVDPLAVAAARRERTDAGAPPDVLTTTRGGIRGSGAVGAYFGVRDDDDDEGRTAATVRARGPPG